MPLYEEIEIEDMTYDPETLIYSYPCPCGDIFNVSLEDLWDGEDVADCQSCTLFITVIYEEEDLPPLPDESDNDDDSVDNGAKVSEPTGASSSKPVDKETENVIDAVASLSINAGS